MAITSSSLIECLATNHPEDDVSTVGGAINAAGRVLDADLATASQLEVVSDGADTRTLTLRYRATNKTVQTTGAISLNGTTPVNLGITAERILEATLSGADASRTVLLRIASAGATQHTFNPNETKARRLMALSVSGAAQKVYYEATFLKNTHSTDSLLDAEVLITADPTSKFEMGVAAAVNGSTTTTNRLTAPAGVTFVDDNVAQAVPGTNLAAGDGIKVWNKMTLGADNAALKNTVSKTLRGKAA